MFDKLIEVLVQFVHLFFFLVVVKDYQRGVVLRWGKFNRELLPGGHWKIPFAVEACLLTNVVPETMTVGPQSLTTRDQKAVVVSTVVTFEIDDARHFLLGIEGGHQVIEDASYGMVSEFVLARTWAELCTMDVGDELTKAVRRKARQYGVRILRVQVCDLTVSRSIRLIQPLEHHSHR